MSHRYTIAWTAPAKRAICQDLPESVAAAALELITGRLADTPHLAGKALRPPFTGIWSARRATYRVLYRIDDDHQTVTIDAIRHRRTAYR